MKMFHSVLSVVIAVLFVAAMAVNVSARDIDFQDFNVIDIYKVDTAPVLDGRMSESDGYGAPVAEITFEQFALENWGIDTEPGFENIHEDADVIPQYCSIYACYTDTTFYYCLVVKDLIHYNNGHDNAYSGGDSCFFNMVGDRDATTDDDRLRYCMALTNSGEIKCINYGSAPISTEDDWVVTRDEASKTTTYEISVPFEDLLYDTKIDIGDFFYFQEGLELSKDEKHTGDVCMTTLPGKNATRNFWKMTFAGARPVVEEVVEEPTPAEDIAAAPEEAEITAPVVAPATADSMTAVAAFALIAGLAAVVLKKRA